MRSLGEGYMPMIKPARREFGVYGADWRVVTGLSGNIPSSMPMVKMMTGMSGMGQMGALDEGAWQQVWIYLSGKISGSDFDTVKKLFDGSWAAELTALKREMNQKKSQILALKGTIPDSQYNQMWNQYLKFEQNTLDAISWFNNGVWKIREIKAYADASGAGFEAPSYISGMGSMGAIPVAVVAIVAVVILAIIADDAYKTSIKNAQFKTIAATGDLKLLNQYMSSAGVASGSGVGSVFGALFDVPQGTTDMIKWVVLGAAVFFGAKMVMDAGGLKGLKETFGKEKA